MRAGEPSKDSRELLKIGNFARLANTNLRTLRYYEEIGLLQPASRSEGGFRFYRPSDVNRVRMIQNLQSLGLQLEQIRRLMSTRDAQSDRLAFHGKVSGALEAQKQLIDDQIAVLLGQKKKVSEALSKLSECRYCESRPTANNNFCEPCGNTGLALPEFLSALY